ncbi:MAG: ABC transporter ATP-binding protein [Geminicoccaceae bacterium]|nr:ABC transporter ATP-binding protein [Geminicoccaceae bacterium]
MIEIHDVHLELESQAGKVHILKGVDLNVQGGTSTSVVGPSGSGKSSLLAVIGGIEKASGGSVRVADTELTALDEDELALFRRRHVGIIFQSFHLIPTMTAAENVALPLELAGIGHADRKAAERLDEVGLSHRLTHYPGQLSGGEQQRVALARALVNDPDLLLADEPTGNLDTGTGRQIIDLLFETRNNRSTTLLLVTHDPGLATMCDMSVTMQDGRLRDAGTAGRSYPQAELVGSPS